jgi:NO-binding membrane sensor protein with MHYT domain/nitrogen-specific signal transduction histidine kinase
MCDICKGQPLAHAHDPALMVLSVAIAIFASYVALDLANSVTLSKGRARAAWIGGGSLAMGVGIWSMHFLGMLAFEIPGKPIGYDIYLLILSVFVAVAASTIALVTVSRPRVSLLSYTVSSLSMGAAIAGMHYIGIASMRISASYVWDLRLVVASILIAVVSSYVALWLAVRFRDDLTARGFWSRAAGGVVMGVAIAGMHYTAMAAMHFYDSPTKFFSTDDLLATEGLANAVIGTTVLILCIALAGSSVDRAFTRRLAFSAQIARIFESITDAFYSVNRKWEFTYVNRVAREVLRQYLPPSKPLLGERLWNVVPDLVGSQFEQEARAAMETGEPKHFEFALRGTDQWIEVRVYPSSDGLSVYFRDITDRRKSQAELEEAVRSRDEFLSIASHELKTPLTALKLRSQMRLLALHSGQLATFSTEKFLKIFEDDARQIDRLVRLVEDMLDIARIRTGRFTVNIRGRCEGHWDRFRMEQVFINLLMNAVKYGGGSAIAVDLVESGEEVHLTVRDEGMGIAPENLERIFMRFERAPSSKDISGLGLGLYIARQIVAMHGGEIQVQSQVGQGSTFTVILPKVPPFLEEGDEEPPHFESPRPQQEV